MDSVEIISNKLVNDEVDLQRAIVGCLKVIDYKTKFTVTLKNSDDDSFYEIYLFRSGYQDEFGQSIDVAATITIFPISWRSDKHDQLPTIPFPHFWHMSLVCREKEFMLPFIIALLRENSDYRLINVEGLLMDYETLSKLHEQKDYNWAYKTA